MRRSIIRSELWSGGCRSEAMNYSQFPPFYEDVLVAILVSCR